MYSVYNIYIYILHFASANKTFHKGTLERSMISSILTTLALVLRLHSVNRIFFHLESLVVQGHRTKN